MRTKPVKGLPTGMIFVKDSGVVKTTATLGPRKLADGDGETITNGHRGVIEHQAVTDTTPHVLFDCPRVRGLADKCRTIHLSHCWEKVRIVAAEVVKDFGVLGQTQIGRHYLHGDYLTIDQFGHRTSLSQMLSFRDCWLHLVNQTETYDNKVVQAHDISPGAPMGHGGEFDQPPVNAFWAG